jgi:hypothetical protein
MISSAARNTRGKTPVDLGLGGMEGLFPFRSQSRQQRFLAL